MSFDIHAPCSSKIVNEIQRYTYRPTMSADAYSVGGRDLNQVGRVWAWRSNAYSNSSSNNNNNPVTMRWTKSRAATKTRRAAGDSDRMPRQSAAAATAAVDQVTTNSSRATHRYIERLLYGTAIADCTQVDISEITACCRDQLPAMFRCAFSLLRPFRLDAVYRSCVCENLIISLGLIPAIHVGRNYWYTVDSKMDWPFDK